MSSLLTFLVHGVRYAVAADDVLEVVRAVAVTPMPGAPPVVLGVVDVRGALVPVLDVRARFGHPSRALDPSEHFVIARAGARRVALRVDAVEALVEVDGATIEDARDAVPSVEHVAGVVRTGEGIVLIHDVHRFLTDAEARSLEGALAADMAESATAISTQ